MSSDTAKENASVVDSSLTEWKIDKGSMEDPDSPCYTENEDLCRSGAEERRQSFDDVGASSESRKIKPSKTRFFIIKSLNHQNIELSVRKGIWATQVMNEPILDEAFHNSRKVILIFSVNMSGFFQGYAQMTSSVGWRRDNIWSQGSGGTNRWGRSFKIKWLRLNDLPFEKTLHLKNPLNQYKPVKISRDCQELPQDIGEALCKLIDGKNDVDVNLNRVEPPSRGNCIEPSSSLRDDDLNVPSAHMLPMLYPTLYQHQAEASGFHLAYQRASGMYLPENLTVTPGLPKTKRSKHSQGDRYLSKVHVDQDTPSQYNAWGVSSERNPLASSLTEDDILEMTYEEYLEAHGRHDKRLYHCAPGTSRCMQKSSASIESRDDLRLGSSSKKRTIH